MGNRVHVVGHIGGYLVHRSSQDNGVTWSAPTVIAPAANNFPMQYGGLFVQGDTVYLLTAEGNMGPTAQHVDFRKSTDNGQTWSNPIRITQPGLKLRRARIVASGHYVHVAGLGTEKDGFVAYFRSTNGGATWEPGVKLADGLGEYGGGQTIAVDGNTLHIPYTKVRNGVGGGDTYYLRSTDNGQTWSQPVYIGEKSPTSDRQARAQVAAADGRAIVVWQREGRFTGDKLPADRLGYNRSLDGGRTWLGPKILPGDTGVDREHHQIWMTSGGGLHVAWSHGSPDDASSPTGYMFSPDYGATWKDREIAMSTGDRANAPHGIAAGANWVHIIAELGGWYVRKEAIDNN